MARLLADEHFPKRAVDKLSALGHDVRTVRQFDEQKSGDGKDDATVLEIAFAERRALITFNVKHFKRLHLQKRWHYGIICCSDRSNRVQLAKAIDAVVKDFLTTKKRRTLRGALIEVTA